MATDMTTVQPAGREDGTTPANLAELYASIFKLKSQVEVSLSKADTNRRARVEAQQPASAETLQPSDVDVKLTNARAYDNTVSQQGVPLQKPLPTKPMPKKLSGAAPAFQMPQFTFRQPDGHPTVPPPQHHQLPPKPVPAIEPVLLEKSRELVKAECKLKRQRIEDKLATETGGTPDCSNHALTHGSVVDVLAKASEAVPFASGFPTPPHDSPYHSDWDSYYSSKADSWISSSSHEHGQANMALPAHNGTAHKDLGGKILNGTGLANAASKQVVDLEADEESDYEPPAPYSFEAPAEYSRQLAETGDIPPPVQVVPNHIPTPAAPQPIRISPLAYSNIGRVGQLVNSGGYESANSPISQSHTQGNASSSSSQHPRNSWYQPKMRYGGGAGHESFEKKRKRGDPPRNKHHEKKAKLKSPSPLPQANSPEIKQEPLSPLNGVTYFPTGRNASVDRPDRLARPRSRYVEEVDSYSVHSPVRYRRVDRDDNDLRRVVTIPYGRQPVSPRRSYVVETRLAEHAPVAYLDRPSMRESIYREVPVQGDADSRIVRAVRSPSPQARRGAYSPEPPALLPPRTVVYDMYGNEYYAHPRRIAASVAPDAYYERVPARDSIMREVSMREPSMREPAMRPATRVVSVYEDDHYREMPPPRIHVAEDYPPRREQFDPRHEDHLTQRQEYVPPEYAHRDAYVESRVPLAEGRLPLPPPPRHEQAPSRTYSRAYSVHPDAFARHDVAGRVARAGTAIPRDNMPPPPQVYTYGDTRRRTSGLVERY